MGEEEGMTQLKLWEKEKKNSGAGQKIVSSYENEMVLFLVCR